MKKRIDFIDFLKGIGIILVVLGHTDITPLAFSYIYSFHMPLFFFISGYLFVLSKHKNFTSFLIAKFKSLIIPYISFFTISVLINYFFAVITKNSYCFSINGFIETLLISKRNNISNNVALWFLTSLFMTEMVFYLLRKFINNDFLLSLVIVAFGLVSCTVFGTLGTINPLPWTLDASLFYMIFFGTGYFLNKYKINSTIKYLFYIIGGLLNLSIIFSPKLYSTVNSIKIIPVASINNIILYIIFAFSGISIYIFMSKLLCRKINFINFFGKNSLIILALHIPLSFAIINGILSKLSISITTSYNIKGLFYTISTLIILTPIIFIINKYFYFILGKTRFKVARQKMYLQD